MFIVLSPTNQSYVSMYVKHVLQAKLYIYFIDFHWSDPDNTPFTFHHFFDLDSKSLNSIELIFSLLVLTL